MNVLMALLPIHLLGPLSLSLHNRQQAVYCYGVRACGRPGELHSGSFSHQTAVARVHNLAGSPSIVSGYAGATSSRMTTNNTCTISHSP